MIYGPDITKRICEELKKAPNIRHICAKFGIDHSTFYRWMGSHPTFHKNVLASLYFGREYVTGAAESIILKGINIGDFRSASFWLTHNEPRYMQKDKGEHYGKLLEMDYNFMKKVRPEDEINFEKIFELFQELEGIFPPEYLWKVTKPIIGLFCLDDKDLPDILKASYMEWKSDKKNVEGLVKKAEIFNPDSDK